MCITESLQAVADPWAYTHPQPALTNLPNLPDKAALGRLRREQREELATRAAQRLDEMTSCVGVGFAALRNGNDRARAWRARAYVSVVGIPMSVSLKGPKGSIDEGKTITVKLSPGEVLVSCNVFVQGQDPNRPGAPRRFTVSPRWAKQGVVLLGLTTYRPREIPAAPVGPIIAARAAKEDVQVNPEDVQLNEAFVKLEDGPFTDIRYILGLHYEEEETVHAMSPAKRRKLRALFQLLANSDATLQDLAQSAVCGEGSEDAPEESAPAPPQATIKNVAIMIAVTKQT